MALRDEMRKQILGKESGVRGLDGREKDIVEDLRSSFVLHVSGIWARA